MKKRYRQMVNTRRLYQLEHKICDDRAFRHLSKQRSLKFLREMTAIIWRAEKIKIDIPEVRFGSGVSFGHLMYSWCDGLTVELVEGQRDVLTLIHELVHALGYDYHDRDFVEMELYLLMKYTPMNPDLLYNKFSPLIEYAY